MNATRQTKTHRLNEYDAHFYSSLGESFLHQERDPHLLRELAFLVPHKLCTEQIDILIATSPAVILWAIEGMMPCLAESDVKSCIDRAPNAAIEMHDLVLTDEEVANFSRQRARVGVVLHYAVDRLSADDKAAAEELFATMGR